MLKRILSLLLVVLFVLPCCTQACSLGITASAAGCAGQCGGGDCHDEDPVPCEGGGAHENGCVCIRAAELPASVALPELSSVPAPFLPAVPALEGDLFSIRAVSHEPDGGGGPPIHLLFLVLTL